jgi:hypothetical protein
MTEAPRQGFSDAASVLAQARHENYEHLVRSATFSKQDAYDELGEVWEDCRHANWDGSGAMPVEQDTLGYAYRFIEALPLGYPLPSVGVEPDGHLTLEWYRNPRWTLSVSVSPEGTLYYAALFGSEDPRGSCSFFDEIPETLLFLLRRVSQP